MDSLLSSCLKQFASVSVLQFVIFVFVELLVLTVVLLVHARRKGTSIAILDVIALFALVVYVNVILQLTLLGRKDGSRIGIKFELFGYLGQGQFSQKMLMYAFLNILLFIPHGCIISMLPWIRREKGMLRLFLTTIICLATSLIIELLQLTTGRGYYELEDLICNTIGGFLGAVLINTVIGYLESAE